MLVPGLVILFLFLMIPLLRVLVPSVFTGDYPFSAYVDFFKDEYYRKIFLRTVKIAVITTFVCMVGGIPTAYFISRCDKKWRGLLLSASIFPMMTNSVIRSFAWINILGSNGIINKAMIAMGLIEKPMKLLYTDFSIIIGSVYLFLPLMIVTVAGVMENIDDDMMEAAQSLGASRSEAFMKVIFPIPMSAKRFVPSEELAASSMSKDLPVSPEIVPGDIFAHPIEDAVEHITHSICTLEFEDHRPLYDWVVRECEFENPPRQIEFAKMYLTNVVTGKRYIKKLVEDGIVDGWDDPRLVTIAALRRRGYTPEALRMFVELVGVSKANSSVDYAMLEYCIREDLKLKRPRMMAVLDPVKLIIDNYPEGQTEMLSIPNNLENPEMGEREVPFSRELYIEREDFMENPPKKYFRLAPGAEVRLRYAYYITCQEVVKDADGNIVELHCTHDPSSRGGSSPDGRKVKGTLHWVSARHAVPTEVRLYEQMFTTESDSDIEEGKTFLDYFNPDSEKIVTAMAEPYLAALPAGSHVQFERVGYFCADPDGTPEHPVFNRTVTLKDSWAKIEKKQ